MHTVMTSKVMKRLRGAQIFWRMSARTLVPFDQWRSNSAS